jgi:hypothetical protein
VGAQGMHRAAVVQLRAAAHDPRHPPAPPRSDRALGAPRWAAVDGALKNGALALKVIREIDPAPQASVSVTIPRTPEEVDALSLQKLRALLGVDVQPAPELG